MQATIYQDSAATLDVVEQYDAEECQSSEVSWLDVAWRSAEAWPLHVRPSEEVTRPWPEKEAAEPQLLAEAPLVALTKQYIEDRYSDNLSLEQVAEALGADAEDLGALVNEAIGMDFSDYFASVRVEKAKGLLLNPNYYFTEIAFELGFESLSQFSQAFTRMAGEPPHAYRARLPGCSASTL